MTEPPRAFVSTLMAAGLPLPEVAAYSGHSVGGLALDAVGEYLAQLLTAAP